MKSIAYYYLKNTTNLLSTTRIQFQRIYFTTKVDNKIKPDEWQTIYKLPSISMLAGLSRLKQYQAAATAITVPIVMSLESSQIISNGTSELFAVIGITGTITLSLYSLLSRNLIGFVYMNLAEKRVKFAYIDVWGRRNNVTVNMADIDINSNKKLFGLLLPIKTSQQTLKMVPLRFGIILDVEKFSYLFGEG